MGEEKKGFFKRLVSGLTKTRDNIVSGMDSIFHGFSKIDDDFYEELEETLIMGDLGVRATMDIIPPASSPATPPGPSSGPSGTTSPRPSLAATSTSSRI